MKFSFLNQLITDAAYKMKENAAYGGRWDDGGSSNLLNKFSEYKNNFIIEMDLRPSELYKLNDIEVGEPKEFSDIIEKYKISLAKNIKL